MSGKLLKIAGLKVLAIMATQAEYGKALRQRFVPHNCGVGPVEAALNTADALHLLAPDLVVSLGSAGSERLKQAHIYQVSTVSYRDMDASAFGFPKGETPFLGLPATIALDLQIPNLPSATLSTGANVVSGEAYLGIEAQMVDMETWSVMRACHAQNVPMIGLRGISDGAEPVAEYADWTRYLSVIDQRLALAFDLIAGALETGSLDVKNWQAPRPDRGE